MSASSLQLVKPPALRPGDTVGIVAPASNIKQADLEAGCEALRRAGYRPFYLDSILDRDLYFAGSVERRARELEEMFERDDVRAIVCARGGYGANYLLNQLDLEKIEAHPKIFVGYSDVTSLLTHFTDAAGLVTFHGPMVAKDWAHEGGVDLASWQSALSQIVTLGCSLESTRPRDLVDGEAEGILYGGCLSILVASLGTPYEIRTAGQDPVPGRRCRQAVSNRSHADAVETGRSSRRSSRHSLRRDARLHAVADAGLHSAGSHRADRRRSWGFRWLSA